MDFLFDEQVIQDERLLGLENRMLDVENRVLDTENEVEGDHFHLKFFAIPISTKQLQLIEK